MKHDIILVPLPFVKLIPQTGPALLKAAVQKAGFSCKVVDWNLNLWNMIKHKEKNTFWDQGLDCTYDEINEFCDKYIDDIVKVWIPELKELDPEWLGLSMYSHRTSHAFIMRLLPYLRKELPHVKLVIGGYGSSVNFYGSTMYENELVDHFIEGEGEIALVELLKGNTSYPGIDDFNPIQIKDINNLEDPDYSDTNPLEYPNKQLYIITSRGCIRNCTFCKQIFKKFRTRDPELVVNEMVYLQKKYNVVRFPFGDSMTNGNPKHFRTLCKKIIEYRSKGILKKPIRWSCFFGCLSRNVIHEKVYRDIKISGCVELNVGIESGSFEVREKMNKRMHDADIYFMIEQCKKYEIPLTLNFMVGYYCETEDDFQKTIRMVETIKRIAPETMINIGIPFALDESYFDSKRYNIKYDSYGNWYYNDNTYQVRMNRWYRLQKKCEELKFVTAMSQKHRISNKLEIYQD